MAAYDDLNVKRIFTVGIGSILVTLVTALAVQVLYYWLVQWQDAGLSIRGPGFDSPPRRQLAVAIRVVPSSSRSRTSGSQPGDAGSSPAGTARKAGARPRARVRVGSTEGARGRARGNRSRGDFTEVAQSAEALGREPRR